MPSSRFAKWWLVAALVIAVAAATTLRLLPHSPKLCVSEQRTGNTYYCVPATEGTRATLSWIHSIEHQPWTETYVVTGETLMLEEITMKSYGAGVPADPGGVATIEDGVIHVRQLHKEFAQVRWIHSHHTHHEVRLGGRHIATRDIPHHAFVELSIKE